MFKIGSKRFRQVACKKNGKAPKGAKKVTRGRSRREICVVPAGKK